MDDDDGLIRDINFGDGIVTETAEGVYETIYWVTDHLGSPRVAFKLDNSEYASVVERNDYYPFGGRWDDGSGHGGTIAATDNRYALSGKERQTMSRMGSYLAAHESLLDFGARFYDPATAIFLQQDPLAEKYYNLSPYAYCANNPVNFVDPDGRSTWVTENADGTYNVVGGNLNDNDLNIYIVTYDEYGNMKIGDSIGTTTSITSFYNTDKDDGIEGWMIESIINPSDLSGINFINNVQQQYLTLLQYIWNARTDKPYDFKVTNGQGEKIDGINIYRGMPIGSDQNGTIYTSARDVGNIVAGYVAGRKGLSWHATRFGFDAYQSITGEGLKWTPEGISTQNAQLIGWKVGFMIYYKKRLSIND